MLMDNKQFGLFLANRRKKLHLSRSFIAEKLGYSKQIIYNWEKGLSFPNMSCWSDLIELLQIDLTGLIECKETKINQNLKFDEKRFVENLKDLRTNKGLTQIELASLLGTNNKTISSWENGASFPSYENFIVLCKVFNVSYSKLFYGEESPLNEEPIKPIKKHFKYLNILIPSLLSIALIGGIGGPLLANYLNRKTSQNYNEPNSNIIVSNNEENSNENHNPLNVDFSISLNKTEITLYIGDSFQLTESHYPINESVTWVSNNINILTVKNGVLTPKSYGVVLVTAYLTNFNDYKASCVVRVKWKSSSSESTIVPVNRDVLEYFYPSERSKARFFFEDKKTIIYEKDFEPNEPFEYDFDEPEFGPFKGIKYTFLGWDYNYDGVVDELPETLDGDTDFVAVYKKEHTNETTSNSKTKFIISDSYSESIFGDDSLITSYNNELIKNVIFMDGITDTYEIGKYYNCEYVSLAKTIKVISGPFPRVTICNGNMYGSVYKYAFKNGINNDRINWNTDNDTTISTDSLKGCSNLKYINFYWKENNMASAPVLEAGAFNGCNNLELVNIYKNFDPSKTSGTPFFNHGDFSAFYETNMSFIDLRTIVPSGQKIVKSLSKDPITILVSSSSTPFPAEYIDPNIYYNILVGWNWNCGTYYGTSENRIISGAALNLPNCHFYYYSGVKHFDGSAYYMPGQTLDGWHFNADGFPTFEY